MASWRKQFILLWTGQAVSIFTSAIVQMSLVWHITNQTKSATMLTLATLVGFVPRAIISALGGVYIDRHNKKKIMLAADGFIAVVSLVLAIVGEFMFIPIWMILLVIFFRSIGAAFHEPSLQAATPLIVPREYLTKYAGYAHGFEAVSDLLSPGVAAVLYVAFPIHRIILIDIIGAAFAAIMLLFISIPHVVKAAQEKTPQFWPEFRAGFAALRDTKGMPMLMTVCALYSVIYSPIGTLLPLITTTHFNAGINGSAIVETFFSVGMILGALLLGIFGSRMRKVPTIATSIGLYGLGTLLVGLLPPNAFSLFVIIELCVGISIPFYHGVRSSMLQMTYPQEILGRVMSLSTSMMRLAMPIGLVLAGTLVPIVGVDNWYAVSGLLAICLAIFTFTAPSLKNCCES